MNHFEVMGYIEKYRIENKIPINQLTKGIMSTRNYSRLLSGETTLTFEDYVTILKKLHVPLFEFSLYLYNCRFFEFIHETNFQRLVDEQNYEEAYTLISPYLKEQKWGSVFAEKTLPMAVNLVLYKLNKINYPELIAQSKRLLKLNDVIKNTYLSLDDFEALFLYSGYCSIDDRKIISDFITNAVIEDSIKILNVSVEHTTSRLHRLAIQLLVSFDTYSESDLLNLKKVANIAFEYQTRAKIYGEDQYMLHLLFAFFKKHHLTSKTLLMEYAISALGSNEVSSRETLKGLLSESDKAYILSNIQSISERPIILFPEVAVNEPIK